MRPSWSIVRWATTKRIDARELAVDVAVAVAGAGLARADVAQHRAGIAARSSSLLALAAVARSRACRSTIVLVPLMFPPARIAARTRSGVAGTRRMRTPVASWIALRIAGAVGISACSPIPLAPNGPTGRGVLDQDRLDRRHVADGRDQIVVQVLGAAGDDTPPSAPCRCPGRCRPRSGPRPASD